MDWIMEKLLERFMVRVLIAAIALVIVMHYLLNHPFDVNSETDAFFYQNVWLYSGFVISFFITGFIFLYVFSKSFDYPVPALKAPAWFALLVTAFLLILLFIPRFGLLRHHPWLFQLIAILIPILVYGIDYSFKRAGYFPELVTQGKYIQTFDLGIIFGTVSIVILGRFVEKGQGLWASSGFVSGAITFQLIMANLLFDPALYRIKVPAGERHGFQRS